mgnify:FL=1
MSGWITGIALVTTKDEVTGRNIGIVCNSLTSVSLEPLLISWCVDKKTKSFPDWENAKECVRILRDFLDGEWLTHMQLFGLATNLIHIKGGQKLMNDTMIKYNQEGKTDYSENNFNIITYVKKVCYHAVPIYKFSEHEEDTDLYDLYSSVSEIRGKIEIVKPIVRTSLNDAVEIFKNKFNEFKFD